MKLVILLYGSWRLSSSPSSSGSAINSLVGSKICAFHRSSLNVAIVVWWIWASSASVLSYKLASVWLIYHLKRPSLISLKLGSAYSSPLQRLAHSRANSPPCSADSPLMVICWATVELFSVVSGLSLWSLLFVGAFLRTYSSILSVVTTQEYKLRMRFGEGSSISLEVALFCCTFRNLWLIFIQSKSLTEVSFPLSWAEVNYQFMWLISSICFLHMSTSYSMLSFTFS